MDLPGGIALDSVLTWAANLGLQVVTAAAVARLGRRAVGAGRERRLIAAWAARTLTAAAWPAAAVAGGAALLTASGTAAVTWEPVPMPLPGLATLTGALGIGGIVLTAGAGRTERRGRLQAARRRVRFGGRAAFLGAGLQVVLWGVAFFAAPGAVQRALVAAGALAGQAGFGTFLMGAGGFVLLLAALSGKPRPSGPVGSGLYIVGYGVLVAAAAALSKLVN